MTISYNKSNYIPNTILNLGWRFISITIFLVLVTEKFSFQANNLNKQIILYFNLTILCFVILLSLIYQILFIFKYLKNLNSFKNDIKNENNIVSLYIFFVLITMQINTYTWITNHFLINYEQTILSILSVMNVIIYVLELMFCVFYLLKFVKITLNNKEGFINLIFIFTTLSLSSTFSVNLGDFINLWFFQIIWFISFLLVIFLYLFKAYKFIFNSYKNNKNIVAIAIFTRPLNLLFLGFIVTFNPNKLLFSDDIKSKMFLIEYLNFQLTFLNNYILYTTITTFLLLLCLFTYFFCFIHKWKYHLQNKDDEKYIWLTFPGSITSTVILRVNDWIYINNNVIYFLILIIIFITYITTFIDTIRLNIRNISILKNAII
ncbi:hypothetical protein [Mycoplasma miroungirhinis]|uniref:Transmembrane protein n=1 Tax=Mycoplasma miroungirhinis TaxID=754516 RepID=A0A6M4JCW2_9MOLU|nr:hypothetical protein [Mycoplasma miroungirhinis]QJR44195.1 hypothetical protein HLA92_01985 [Mycoplasma miroungirhinis]